MTVWQGTGTATNQSGQSATVNFSITVNDAPIIDSVVVNPQSANPGVQRTITITAHDPQGGALTYAVSIPGLVVQATGQPNVFTVTP